jgi:hypothetical protein
VPPVPRAAAILALLLTSLVVAACGDGGGGGDSDEEKAVRDVVVAALTTEDVRDDCGERLSDRLIKITYETRARCIEVDSDDDDEPAKSVDFASVEVDGDTATADITIRGGDGDGTKGALSLVKAKGKWQIDDLSVELLRSQVEAGLRNNEKEGTLPRGGLDCMQRGLLDKPDAELRRVAYQLIGETEEGKRRTYEILSACKGEGGASLLRLLFEKGIGQALVRRNASQREADCVNGALREQVTEQQLIDLLIHADDSQAQLTRILTPIISRCDGA